MNMIRITVAAIVLACLAGCVSGDTSASFPQHDYWWRTSQ